MAIIEAKQAFLSTGWHQNVALDVGEDGGIRTVTSDNATLGPDAHEVLIPGLANVHSHAFQRALAGFAETQSAAQDDFWSWRKLMYALSARLTPQQVQTIATQLFTEMLKSGTTHVGEFHYLHKSEGDESGLEMASALVDAASATGIGLTLLPVLYSRAGFDATGPEPHQRRFTISVTEYLTLYRALNDLAAGNSKIRLGFAFHSLRAVGLGEMQEVLQERDALDPGAPVHIHIAEQIAEVRQCQQALGKRPIEWLYDNFDVKGDWCLVHATHMVPHEVEMVAKSGAVAGLCPTTEANLGDGIFPLGAYQEIGGAFGIGSDSHITVDPFDELRLLEYSNRLDEKRRLIGQDETSLHCGAALYRQALAGGAQAVGVAMGAIAPGQRADLLSIDPHHARLAGRNGDYLIDGLVFGQAQGAIRDVMVGGHWVVKDRRHDQGETTLKDFRDLLEGLDISSLITE